MRKTTIICCLFLLAVSWGNKGFAQDAAKPQETAKAPEPAHYYHLEFVVQEVGSDGKPTNSRTYSGVVSTSRTDRGFSMRTGSRVPITSASSGEEKNLSVQFQYVDVGVSIDAKDARELGDKLALSLNADISSLAGTSSPVLGAAPVIRQNRWQADALIPIGKATVVFTSDVLDNKGGMQLVVTVTLVK